MSVKFMEVHVHKIHQEGCSCPSGLASLRRHWNHARHRWRQGPRTTRSSLACWYVIHSLHRINKHGGAKSHTCCTKPRPLTHLLDASGRSTEPLLLVCSGGRAATASSSIIIYRPLMTGVQHSTRGRGTHTGAGSGHTHGTRGLACSHSCCCGGLCCLLIQRCLFTLPCHSGSASMYVVKGNIVYFYSESASLRNNAYSMAKADFYKKDILQS